MIYIKKVVDDIYKRFMIPFQLEIEDRCIYSSEGYNDNCEFLEKKFTFNKAQSLIRVNLSESNTIDLLIYCVENTLKEVFILKKDLLKTLIEGKSINREFIKSVWPTITSDFTLICIYVDKYFDEIFSLIKEGYINSGIDVINENQNIIMIGNFEDVSEHTQSIKESIEESYITKFYISYSSVKNFEEVKKVYEDSLYKIELAKKYNISDNIFDEKKLMFELIIDSVSEKNKVNIYNNFNNGFSKLDSEMIRTIDVFLKCGLNLSDAARELYIHRNTLIYRLDKIQKYTTYDIREFNSAVLFKIVFFLWKQKNKKQITN